MTKKLIYNYKILALNYIQDKNITEALNTLVSAVKVNNKDSDLLNLLGLCLYKKCKFKEAKNVFEKSVSLGSQKANKYLEYLKSEKFKSLKVKYRLGIEGLKYNDEKKVEEVFSYIMKEHPELIEPYYILIELNLQKENLVKVKELIEGLTEQDFGNKKIKDYEDILEYKKLEQKNFNSEEVEVNHKEIAEFRFLLGISYEEVGKIDLAIEEYKKYIDESEEKNFKECALYNLIRLLNRVGDEEERGYYNQLFKSEFSR